MLIQQHTLLCGEEVKLSDFEKAFKAEELDDDEKLEENFLGKERTKEADQDINQVFNGLVPATIGGRALSDQCFPVSPISYKGASISIDVKHVCTLLEVISMLLYLAAYVTAFHILFRALTEG
ncbi:virulence factor TspB C-terminal domain-related protein [Pseudoteredinibacter isoporae]|nr:virulence factor TspB C-terminal domain-related protein [Pseudoteredinibacter isoporae]MBB6523845.1 hypothetical protein [Pseudoteredinibacter isoporae]NHO89362.1 hypothetical protein [Pseudoteredinibacter isoporae]NIB22469.1 hypothetical protein [Pseudoteredinibacter isoporae]